MRAQLQLAAVWPVLAAGVASAAQDRAQLAIVTFDATPVGWTVPPPHIGATVAELMLDRLMASRACQIVDGQWLEPEGQGSRDRAAMDRLLSSAAESGVDFVLLGSVTRFTTELAEAIQRSVAATAEGLLKAAPVLTISGKAPARDRETSTTLAARPPNPWNCEFVNP